MSVDEGDVVEPALQKKIKVETPLLINDAVDEYVVDRDKYHVLSEFDKLYDCTMTLTDIIDFRNNNKFFVV